VGRDGHPIREVRVRGFWARILGATSSVALVADPDSTGYRLSESPLPAR
jgi:hypothetical protein